MRWRVDACPLALPILSLMVDFACAWVHASMDDATAYTRVKR